MSNNEECSFGGMILKQGDVKSFEKHFEEIYCDDVAVYLSKKEFIHEEEDLTFKYKYMVEVMNMEEMTGEKFDEPISIDLQLVVSPENVHEKQAYDIKSMYGLEDEEDYELTYRDVHEYGMGVRFATESLELKDGIYMLVDEKVIEKLNALATMYQFMDSVRGVYLDIPWNMVGTNGWNTVKLLINNDSMF